MSCHCTIRRIVTPRSVTTIRISVNKIVGCSLQLLRLHLTKSGTECDYRNLDTFICKRCHRVFITIFVRSARNSITLQRSPHIVAENSLGLHRSAQGRPYVSYECKWKCIYGSFVKLYEIFKLTL
jgi:hypothetical protein